ncbi:MAG: hypothetical protein HOG49_36680, partial [Candidatus Scalindua sp.]|nr:hypothetical protein [Candidatus Scalindua sp.]
MSAIVKVGHAEKPYAMKEAAGVSKKVPKAATEEKRAEKKDNVQISDKATKLSKAHKVDKAEGTSKVGERIGDLVSKAKKMNVKISAKTEER